MDARYIRTLYTWDFGKIFFQVANRSAFREKISFIGHILSGGAGQSTVKEKIFISILKSML